MILSGEAIANRVGAGAITIDPFDAARLNPASYTFAIADELFEVTHTRAAAALRFDWRAVPLEDGAWRLAPRTLYLATTAERIGAEGYAARLTGRPALGWRGLCVQVTADLGHHGAIHRWTLELVASVETQIRPGDPIGQVSFWALEGAPAPYRGDFAASDRPLRSRLHLEPPA